jgi:hypothetical protein
VRTRRCQWAPPATTYLPRSLPAVKMAPADCGVKESQPLAILGSAAHSPILLMTLGHLVWAGRCPWAPLATTYLPRSLPAVNMAPADCAVKESRPLDILGSEAHSQHQSQKCDA